MVLYLLLPNFGNGGEGGELSVQGSFLCRGAFCACTASFQQLQLLMKLLVKGAFCAGELALQVSPLPPCPRLAQSLGPLPLPPPSPHLPKEG